MKRLLLVLLSSLLVMSSAPDIKEEYVRKYSDIAVSEMRRTGVPASITLAQGIVESAAGTSVLAVKGNNHFGIKCHGDWKGKTMKVDDDRPGECFRVYPRVEDSYRNHSDFLRYQDRYKNLFDLKTTDYRGWAKGLKKAGYATDPAYPAKLIKLIDDYRLYRFDTGVQVDTPSPSVSEAGVKVPAAGTFSEVFGIVFEREMYMNGVMYVEAMEGESYASIAAGHSLFIKEILRFNDLESVEDPDAPLEKGTVVYLQQKRRRASRGNEKYIVSHSGESLRDISQRFAVRLSSLKRRNNLKDGAVLSEGDTLSLR